MRMGNKGKPGTHSSEIRCQWDPERDLFGNPLGKRCCISIDTSGAAAESIMDAKLG